MSHISSWKLQVQKLRYGHFFIDISYDKSSHIISFLIQNKATSWLRTRYISGPTGPWNRTLDPVPEKYQFREKYEMHSH